ncbi:GlcG/HbpS family heme-binding protein [Rhizobium sp. ZK1]|uniref:GlcG/HbpS family heme-binding protein n=1 Tax=Rhizobium sp. ZK1 TaxID=3389872 RepID=UPI0039F6C32E
MYVPQVTLGAVKAAETKADEIGVHVTIVIVDRGGEQIAMARMDGAWPGAFDLALGKAQTARSFHAPSATFVLLIQPGASLFTVGNTSAGKYVILPGGVPIKLEGHVAGAVGVSGGSSEQDALIAAAALEAAVLKQQEKL